MDYYNNQNYYDILGIDKSATISSIERAKDRLKFGDPDDRAPFSMWTKIDEAYSVLSNPEKRREYDKKLEESKTNTTLSPVAKNNIDLNNLRLSVANRYNPSKIIEL